MPLFSDRQNHKAQRPAGQLKINLSSTANHS
jgi:hypothetical protein